MYLVSVTPISKSSAYKTLTYFSTLRIPPGTIVKVPIRNSEARAVVTSSRSAVSARADIRQAAFALRKISKKDIFEAGLSEPFLSAINETARFYSASSGALLASILPKMILDEPEIFLRNTNKSRKTSARETLLLQMEAEERFGQYRALVRQCFARKKSVLFVVPTHFDAEKAFKELSPGIELYVYNQKTWGEAMRDGHPVLFITTIFGVAFDRTDIDTIIIERENSRAYRTQARPYIHIKIFLENLARETDRQLILGDSVLSLETLHRWKEKGAEHGELSLVRWRLPATSTTLVDTSAKPDQNGKFEIFSPELKSLIEKALEEKGRIFLFGARKGLAPTTVCGDCGYILPCLNCGAPVVLHSRSDLKNPKGRIFVCHACGTKRDSNTTCGYCGSWKLVPLGIGIERIASEAKRLFPESNISILDKDHVKSEARAKSIAQKFNKEGGILVGTELALFHIEKAPYVALVSADALFSIPDFGVHEKIFYLVSRLREMSERETIIQTRNIGKQVLAWAAQGNIIDFYMNEVKERENLSYPPFSIFIKIIGEKIPAGIFLKWRPETYKDSLIIRIEREEWPDQELLTQLALLGPQFTVKVDPESIL